MNVSLLIVLVASLQQNGYRSQETPSGTRGIPARPGAWTVEGRGEGSFSYDTNVWLLDGGQMTRLKEDRASDQTSGRFDDMNAVDDLIFTPDIRLEAKGPSPFGRKLTAWVDVEYPVYTRSPRRSHLDVGLGAVQPVGDRGHLELFLNVVPEFFKKNYLADAVDVNGNGDISSSERIYENGTYFEWELGLEYRHELLHRKSKDLFGLEAGVAAGVRNRTFDSPFDGRDELAPFARLTVRFEHGPSVRWGFRYRFETIGSPTESEVVLIDEVAFGSDVNGDGIFANDARTVTSIDRTRTEHAIGLFFEVELSRGVAVQAGIQRLFRLWDSGETLDFAHRDREDVRDEIELTLKFHLAKGWDMRVGWDYRLQSTDRGSDPGGASEVVDYRRHVILLSTVFRW